jgi:hypothetical protein
MGGTPAAGCCAGAGAMSDKSRDEQTHRQRLQGSTLSSARPAWSGSRTIWPNLGTSEGVHGRIRRGLGDGLGGRQTARGRCPAVFQVAEACRELHAELCRDPPANSTEPRVQLAKGHRDEGSRAAKGVAADETGSLRSFGTLAIINDGQVRPLFHCDVAARRAGLDRDPSATTCRSACSCQQAREADRP